MKKTPKKKENIFYKHRYFLFFFLYTVFYHVVIVNRLQGWKMNELTYSVYCVDFSFGFASKLLPGAVFRLLAGNHPSKTAATIYAIVLILLFFCALALVLESFMKRIPENHKSGALLLVLLFLSGAYTFSIFTKWVGMSDTAWLWIILFFIVCLEQKHLRFAIPILFLAALMIHFSALVFILPLFSTLLLYRAAVCEEKKGKRQLLAVFAVSLTLSAVAFTVLMLNESNMICSMEEFHRKLKENGTEYYFYFDYSFFHRWGGESFVSDTVLSMQPSFTKFIYLFYYQVKLVYDLLRGETKAQGWMITLCGFALTAPAVIAFERFMLFRLRKAGSGLKRFSGICMMAMYPFVFVLGILFAISVDMTRYYTYAFLMPFICMLVVLYHEAEARVHFFERFHILWSNPAVKIYCLTYVLTTFLPSL